MPECKVRVDNAIEVQLQYGNGTKLIHVVQHAAVNTTFAPSVAFANNLLTRIAGLLTSSGLVVQMPSSWALGGVALKDLRTTDNGYIQSNGSGAPGTGTGDILPYQIAACMTIRTARAGKRYRGRSYFAPFLEVANGPDNHYAAAFQTAFNAFCNGYLAAFSGDGMNLGVLHRPLFNRTETTCTIAEEGFITAATQCLTRDTMWETQRRRRS